MRAVLQTKKEKHHLRWNFENFSGEYTDERNGMCYNLEEKKEDVYQVKVGKTPFHHFFYSKWRIRITDSNVEVQERWTMLEVILVIVGIISWIYAIAGIELCIQRLTSPYATFDILDVIVTFVIFLIGLLFFLAEHFLLRKKGFGAVIDFLDNQVLKSNRHSAYADILNENREKAKEIPQSLDEYMKQQEIYECLEDENGEIEIVLRKIVDDPNPVWKKISQKRRNICLFGIGIFGLLMLFMFLRVPGQIGMTYGLWFGISFSILNIGSFALMMMAHSDLKKGARVARCYQAQVCDILKDDYEKKKYKVRLVYEFCDGNGEIHRVAGADILSMRADFNVKNVLGKKQKIWYAPEKMPWVLTGDEKPVISPIIKMNGMSSCLVLFLFFSLLLGFGIYQEIDRGNVDKVGKSLKIEWEDDYEPTGTVQADVESDTVQWICACYADRVELEGEECQFGVIGMYDPTDAGQVEKVQEYLEDTWDITNRKSAISTINSLLERGTRAKYDKFIRKMKKDGYLEQSELSMILDIPDREAKEKDFRYQGAYRAYTELGECGIDAWDYCRAMRLAGLSYVAGYFTIEESLDQCLPIAQQLQKEFDSWEELTDSYRYGYMFWVQSSKKGAWVEYKLEKNVDSLLYDAEQVQAEPTGPYSYDFDMELVDTWN